jgi:hypothetical protein
MDFSSWRTTAAGFGVLLIAVGTFVKALLDGDPATVPDFDSLLVAGAGIGLLFARDNKVSSEAAGIK